MESNKKFWHRVSRFYTKFMNNNAYVYSYFNTVLSKYLNQKMNVLEIGCGTGQMSFLLINKVNTLVATDFAEGMISRCKKNNHYDNLTFQVEDGSNLSFQDNSFDAIVIANVLHIVPNSDLVLSEIKRVLKPDGIIFAPIFIYDKKKYKTSDWLVEKIGLWFLERIGFKTYKKYISAEYINYLKAKGFDIVHHEVLRARPMDECIVIGKNGGHHASIL